MKIQRRTDASQVSGSFWNHSLLLTVGGTRWNRTVVERTSEITPTKKITTPTKPMTSMSAPLNDRRSGVSSEIERKHAERICVVLSDANKAERQFELTENAGDSPYEEGGPKDGIPWS